MRFRRSARAVRWLLAIVASLLPGTVRADAALDSLVAHERAFAAMSVARGMKEAFLAYLAEDAVVFQPTATNGRKVWEARPPSTATLNWESAFAEVSSSGDLGYTTGPWEFHPPADSAGTPPTPDRYAYGHFNSVWKKQKGGAWRVLADIGVSHGKPERGVGSGQFSAGPTLPIRTMKGGRVNLASVDRDFSKAMRTLGMHAALAAHAATDLRLNLEGKFPSYGIEDAQARLDSLAGFFEFKAEGSGLASSGDLGFTYGLAERYISAKAAPSDTSVYMNVWRQEDGRNWKLALSVLNPLRGR